MKMISRPDPHLLPVSLDVLTLLDTTPVELIHIAAETGYSAVSLWVQPPALPGGTLAVPSMATQICRALAETGVKLGNLEVFNINFDGDIASYEPALELGAHLGGVSATAIDFGPDRPDIPERFAQFFELAKKCGLAAYLEPISMGRTRTLKDALRLIAAAGVDGGVVLDFLHFVRTGSTLADLAQVPANRIAYVQICDGPLTMAESGLGTESMAERLYPGEGEFPLVELLRALPANAKLAVETPSQSRSARGESPRERARQAMTATRRLFEQTWGK